MRRNQAGLFLNLLGERAHAPDCALCNNARHGCTCTRLERFQSAVRKPFSWPEVRKGILAGFKAAFYLLLGAWLMSLQGCAQKLSTVVDNTPNQPAPEVRDTPQSVAHITVDSTTEAFLAEYRLRLFDHKTLPDQETGTLSLRCGR